MNTKDDKNQNNIQAQVDAIAQQWVNIVFAQIQAKKLATKKPIKINNKYEHATQ